MRWPPKGGGARASGSGGTPCSRRLTGSPFARETGHSAGRHSTRCARVARCLLTEARKPRHTPPHNLARARKCVAWCGASSNGGHERAHRREAAGGACCDVLLLCVPRERAERAPGACLLAQGWTLLAEHCPRAGCAAPLLRSRDAAGQLYCPQHDGVVEAGAGARALSCQLCAADNSLPAPARSRGVGCLEAACQRHLRRGRARGPAAGPLRAARWRSQSCARARAAAALVSRRQRRRQRRRRAAAAAREQRAPSGADGGVSAERVDHAGGNVPRRGLPRAADVAQSRAPQVLPRAPAVGAHWCDKQGACAGLQALADASRVLCRTTSCAGEQCCTTASAGRASARAHRGHTSDAASAGAARCGRSCSGGGCGCGGCSRRAAHQNI
jgi:uncharacterized Zn finger protein (UPF0148 family)